MFFMLPVQKWQERGRPCPTATASEKPPRESEVHNSGGGMAPDHWDPSRRLRQGFDTPGVTFSSRILPLPTHLLELREVTITRRGSC